MTTVTVVGIVTVSPPRISKFDEMTFTTVIVVVSMSVMFSVTVSDFVGTRPVPTSSVSVVWIVVGTSAVWILV